MQTFSRLLFVGLCLFLASSSLAQDTVVTTSNPVTNVTTAGNETNVTTTTTTTNTTNTTVPAPITGTNTTLTEVGTLPNATNSTAGLNETIITDSSQLGSSVVSTSPFNSTTNVSGTPSNDSIVYSDLLDIERSNSIRNYPTSNYTLYLVDIHFISGNLSAQYIAHHFCHFVNEDLLQCALYNDTTPNARFIGNEYFITKALFDTLPTEERNLWHSHPFEVQSGLFVAPDLSEDDEFTVMEWLMGTFGKVSETWSFFDNFPFGSPKLGMALALDSQVDWNVADQMDRVLNLSTTHQQRRQQRESLIAPPRTPGADSYLFTGNALQYQVYQILLENNGTILPQNTPPPAANTTTPAPPVNTTTPTPIPIVGTTTPLNPNRTL